MNPFVRACSPSAMRVDALARLVLTVSSDARESVCHCGSCWPRAPIDSIENWDVGRDVTAKAGGGVRVRMGVGTIGGASGAALPSCCLTSSNVAFGEDIERPFGFLGGTGEGDGEGEAVAFEGNRVASGGCV